MPLVTTAARLMSDGTIVRHFIDTVGTQQVAFTYPTTQSYIELYNRGNAPISVSAGAVSTTVQPGAMYTATIDFGAVNLTSQSGLQPFELRTFEKQAGASVGKSAAHPIALAFGTRLNIGVEPAVILLQGDSTGNEGDEWFYKTLKWLAAQFPGYTVTHRLWNDSLQAYDAMRRLSDTDRVIQTGSAGDAYVGLPGTIGVYVTATESVAQRITGDIDIRVKCAPNTWARGGSFQQQLITKFGAAGNRGWRLMVSSTGLLVFEWSPDGTTQIQTYSTTTVPTSNDGKPLWVRVAVDVDDGSGNRVTKFYTSQTGDASYTWNQLGTTVTTAGVTSIFASTAPIELGYRSSGSQADFVGKIYEAQVLDGIDGKPVCSPDMDFLLPVGANFKDVEGNTWSLVGSPTYGGSPGILALNASHPGAAISYSTDATRFGLQTPIEPALALVSYSHNESWNTVYQSTYEGLLTQIKTKYPNAGIVCVTQNPRYPGSLYATEHGVRCRQIAMAAAKGNYGLIDAHREWLDTPNWQNTLLRPDNLHPNADGSTVWANAAIKFLKAITRDG